MHQIVLFIRPGDPERINQMAESFQKLSDQELIQEYNASVDIGLHVKAQGLKLVAMNNQFNQRFDKSPIEIIHNSMVQTTGKIFLEVENGQNTWYHV